MSKSPFKFLLQFTVAAALSVPVLVGCGNAEEAGDDGVVSTTGDELTTCNAGTQIAYQNGRNLGALKLMKIDDKLTTIKTGHAYLKLKTQMAARGVTLSINSGFRTMDEQKYFYKCYTTKSCNGGNLAAKPGYSNHQHGRALDLQINDHAKFRAALKALGLTSKWKATVRGERWHWEYFGTDPGGICDADSTEVGEVTEASPDTEPVEAEGDQVDDYAEDGSDAPDYGDENLEDGDDAGTGDSEEGETQTASHADSFD